MRPSFFEIAKDIVAGAPPPKPTLPTDCMAAAALEFFGSFENYQRYMRGETVDTPDHGLIAPFSGGEAA